MNRPLTDYSNAERERRLLFDSIAAKYDKIRPRYPEVLFDYLAEVARLAQGARVLEIGPGTGQATELLGRRGYQVTAVEPGSDLVRRAATKLADFSNVQLIAGFFEEVSLTQAEFDAVVAASSFHWVDVSVRFVKSAHILKSGGCLALIETKRVSDGKGDVFFHATQPIYRRFYSGDGETPGYFLHKIADLQPMEIDESLFSHEGFRVVPVDHCYSAAQYAQLLATYSQTLALPEVEREAFLAEMRALIRTEFGDCVTISNAFTLCVARKKS